MRTLSLIVLASLALACQSPPSTSESEPKTQPGSQPGSQPDPKQPSGSATPSDPGQSAELTCTAEPLARELASYCDFDLGVPPLVLPQVAWTATPYHPLATRVIALDQAGITDPEGEGTVSIKAWLADPPRRIPEPGEMAFAIAADVPATTVAELQRGLFEAGRSEVRYLVHIAEDRPIPQPRNPTMLTGMRENLPSSANERVVFVAKAVQGYAETCAPVASVFPQLAQVSSGDRCAKLSELASTALVECGCSDLSEIMTLLYALTVGFDVPPGRSAAVPVALDPQHPVVAAEGATWGEIATHQFANTQLHRLWIEPAGPTDPKK